MTTSRKWRYFRLVSALCRITNIGDWLQFNEYTAGPNEKFSAAGLYLCEPPRTSSLEELTPTRFQRNSDSHDVGEFLTITPPLPTGKAILFPLKAPPHTPLAVLFSS